MTSVLLLLDADLIHSMSARRQELWGDSKNDTRRLKSEVLEIAIVSVYKGQICRPFCDSKEISGFS